MKKGQAFNPFGRRDLGADPRILEEIQRRTPLFGGNMELKNLPAGIALTPKTVTDLGRSFVLPFHPYAVVSNGGNLEAYLSPALAYDRHIRHKNTDGGLAVREPLINGKNSMWEEPIVPLPLAGNISFNYLHYNTDYLGNPTTNFNVNSYATSQNFVHHVPPDPDGTGGVNGEYYISLFETNIGNANALNLKYGGIWQHDQALWQGLHEGGGAEPYREYDEEQDIHYFRSHLRGHGHNTVQHPATINHNFFGRNTSPTASGFGYVYTGNTTPEAAEFNPVQERPTQPQVKVTQATAESPVQVQGNGNDLTLNFTDCNANIVYTLSFIDGLVQQAGSANINIGDCCSNTNSNTP